MGRRKAQILADAILEGMFVEDGDEQALERDIQRKLDEGKNDDEIIEWGLKRIKRCGV